MRRTLAILALSGLVAAVAGSASVVAVNGGFIQAGSSEVSCDKTGVGINWGLEVDTNTVENVRLDSVDPLCVNVLAIVRVYDGAGAVIAEGEKVLPDLTTSGLRIAFALTPAHPSYPTPESIERVKVWFEG